ncbi:hypothetical protein SALBM311S_10590 [Streptomyces alboniger]
MNEPQTDPTRPASPAGRPRGALTRRRFWQLGAAAAVTAGAASLLPERASAETSASADPTAQDYFDRAAELAGDNPVLGSLVSGLTAGYTPPRPPAPAPLRIFDNVAVLGVGFVSATAILTPRGIILIDALDTPDEAEQYIVTGLRSLGADPSTIKYVVVTHGHGDHFGGAQYLADQYGARVTMAPADWDLVASTSPADAPTRDLDIADGQKLTLGGTTVTLHHTPGHSHPGRQARQCVAGPRRTTADRLRCGPRSRGHRAHLDRCRGRHAGVPAAGAGPGCRGSGTGRRRLLVGLCAGLRGDRPPSLRRPGRSTHCSTGRCTTRRIWRVFRRSSPRW